MPIQYLSQYIFQDSPWLLGFSKPFHIHAKENLAKRKQFCSPQGLNSHPFNNKANAQLIQPIYTFVNPIKSKVK